MRRVIVPNFLYVAFVAVPLDFLGESHVIKLREALLGVYGGISGDDPEINVAPLPRKFGRSVSGIILASPVRDVSVAIETWPDKPEGLKEKGIFYLLISTPREINERFVKGALCEVFSDKWIILNEDKLDSSLYERECKMIYPR